MITQRIAAMLEAGVPQRSILALTFTNKAAREMAQRVREISGGKLRDLVVSTFHSFGVQVLRRDIRLLGYRDNFSIYDTSDQVSLLRETAREHKTELDAGEAYRTIGWFSRIKSGRMPLSELAPAYAELYEPYQSHLTVYNAVDFDDLIALPVQLFSEHPEVLAEYHDRFRYLMVDEFQDTSADQYRFMKLLADGHRNIAVVGDDDQSIYSWRGANYENFMQFEADFPEAAEIKLEQNYRSTDTILAAANGVIANNTNRKGKALWTGLKSGPPIELFLPEDESQEGLFIAESIKTLAMTDNLRYGDVGVLVRTNSLSRAIEMAFLSENVPYRVSGGESFFQRKEIKDVTAYLRVLANPDDEVSLFRTVNTPRRGIGRKTLEALREVADRKECSLYSAAGAVVQARDAGSTADAPLSARATGDLAAYLDLIHEYRPKLLSGRKMAETVRELIDRVDYWAHLVSEHQTNDKVAKWKYRNIELFIQLLEEFEADPDLIDPSIFDFLGRITLDQRDDGDGENDPGKVNLMTIHAAKGLEHDVVYVAGCEDGIIPHARALEEDPANLEEERRLFYVALTRAKRRLFISSCRTRKVMRERIECSPSPFLSEISPELIITTDGPAVVDEEEGMDYFQALKAKFLE